MNATLPGWLRTIEHLGNRLLHPTLLFVWLALLLWPLTLLCANLDIDARHPVSGAALEVRALLSAEGVRYMLSTLVSNFTGFAPLGIVLVAMLGIGVAERSGLLGAALTALVRHTPERLLTPVIALAGVLSSIAVDAGYVVLVPIAALLFLRAGRSPLLGIAVAFAAVSGGFSANLLIGPIDALLAGLSSEAAHILVPTRDVSAAGNYWFIIASTLLVTLLVSGTASVMSRYLPAPAGRDTTVAPTTDTRALRATLAGALVYLLAIGMLVIPDGAPLRDATTGSLLTGPFMHALVVLVAVGFAVCGIIFGFASGSFHSAADIIDAMEASMRSMAGYLVLMFFAAQFVAWFNWSGLGILLAVKGAGALAALQLPSALTLVGVVLLTALINLFIGSASAKWALLAPVFIPMLMLAGVDPQATQAAFRVGDSSTNIITPLMPYFALVLGFARQHQPETGIGSLLALMLPFSLVLLLGWSLLLFAWIAAGWPLGPTP